MNSGEIPEGGAVVRVRTEMDLPNPALRDWPALRILDAHHEGLGDSRQYRVWPLLDFQSAIDDHECGVTHIIRGKDLMDSTRKQKLLYKHFKWEYPETMYWGRIKVHEFGKISKSEIKAAIDEGSFEDWNDIRLPTLSALRRRGFRGGIIRDFWIDLGITQKDISISMQTIEAYHAKKIDFDTGRRSFVRDPVTLTLDESSGADPELSIPKHPDGTVQGSRYWIVGSSVVVQSSDVGIGSIRLKEYADIKVSGESAAIESLSRSDDRPVVHWLPSGMGRDAVLHRPDGGHVVSESGLLEDFELEVGKVYQLERVGFAKLEELPENGPASLLWLHR
jgi:glutamyl-tRNA synthetase